MGTEQEEDHFDLCTKSGSPCAICRQNKAVSSQFRHTCPGILWGPSAVVWVSGLGVGFGLAR